MAQNPRTLLIDATAEGPHGPLAASLLDGRPALAHLIDHASRLQPANFHILVRPEHEESCRSLAGESSKHVTSLPRPADSVLRIDRLYDARKLARAWRGGRDLEAAAIWRIEPGHDLALAETELRKRRTFQPLGRFWAIEPARAIARAFRATSVRPNHLTLAAGLLMLSAALLVAGGSTGAAARLGTAALLALALVLDTADGHLARLQNTTSACGRWLDAFLDETADMALHAAVAWAAFAASGQVAWLGIGMLYAMGKYLFFASNVIWDEGRAPATGAQETPTAVDLRGLAHWLGHADVRWHAWIVLAALGALRWELAVFSAYYPLRALAGACRKAGGRCHA